MRGTLVVQTAFLGDQVLTSPLLAHLAERGRGPVYLVTTPAGAELLRTHPSVSKIRVLHKRGLVRGLVSMLDVARWLRNLRPEAAVAAQRSHRTAWLLRMSRAAVRVGFRDAPGRWAYTHAVPWRAGVHAVHRYLALSTPLGGEPEAADPRPRLEVPDEALRRVRGMLAGRGVGDRPWILVAPGSVWPTKQWLPGGYAEVIRRLRKEEGWDSVLTGSPGERELCEVVARQAGGAAVVAGETRVGDLPALASLARVVLTNDSGPGHVASAVGTPVVAVFGPTHPRLGYAPYGPEHIVVQLEDLECRPCHHHGPRRCPLGHFRCMRDLPPDRVYAAVRRLMARDPVPSMQGAPGGGSGAGAAPSRCRPPRAPDRKARRS